MLRAALGRPVLTYLYAALAFSALSHACSPPAGGPRLLRLGQTLWRCLLGAAALAMLGVTLLPLEGLTHQRLPLPMLSEQSRALASALQVRAARRRRARSPCPV
eukprot:4988264-Prymnesium_polylepis.2